jgi:hypothetical protein
MAGLSLRPPAETDSKGWEGMSGVRKPAAALAHPILNRGIVDLARRNGAVVVECGHLQMGVAGSGVDCFAGTPCFRLRASPAIVRFLVVADLFAQSVGPDATAAHHMREPAGELHPGRPGYRINQATKELYRFLIHLRASHHLASDLGYGGQDVTGV